MIFAGLALGWGLLLGTLGILFRLGRSLQINVQGLGFYSDSGLSRGMRHAYLVYPVMGVGFLAGAVALLDVLPAPAVTGCWVAVGLALVTSLGLAWWGPHWLEPSWVREEAARGYPLLAKVPTQMLPINWAAVALVFLTCGVTFWAVGLSVVGGMAGVGAAASSFVGLLHHRRWVRRLRGIETST